MTVHNDIDQVFKKGLSDYSEKAPNFIWDNIEQSIKFKKAKRKRTILYAAAASIALLLSFGAGFMVTKQNLNTQISENTPQNINTNANEIIKAPANDITSANKTSEPSTINNNNEQNIAVQKNNSNVIKHAELKSTNNKSNTIPIEKSITKAKKASSSGILLAPVYGETGTYNSTDNSMAYYNEKENNNLKALQPKKEYLVTESQNKDLKYEIWLLPMTENFTEVKPKTNEYNWGVGVCATPLLSYRNVQNSTNAMYEASSATSNKQSSYQNEKALISYSAGVDVNYKVAKRWKIQTGLYYSEIGQISENINLTSTYASNNDLLLNTTTTINTSNGNIVLEGGPSTISRIISAQNKTDLETVNFIDDGKPLTANNTSENAVNFIQAYEYYELPVIVNYSLIDKKLNVNISGGISTNFLSNNSVYLQEGNKRQDIDAEVDGIKSVNYTSIVGIGIQYPIWSQIYINLNPSFRYSLNSISNDENVYPYSFGIFTGIRYKF